jgi:basic membrane protein A
MKTTRHIGLTGFFRAGMVALLCIMLPQIALANNKSNVTAVIYDTGALDTDHAFIRMARTGAMKAKDELGAQFDEFRAPEKEALDGFMRKIASRGYGSVIAVGYQYVFAVLSLAEEFPNTTFTVIDGLVPPIYPNVQSISFKDHEGSFLIGMVAAYSSQNEKIGFIGGMDIPLIRSFETGFKQGARFVRPNIMIATDMVGNTPKAWTRPDIAYELAVKQFHDGQDVIFSAAGGSTIGVLRAANDKGKLAIGVDTNQNSIFPGHVLTSLVKRVDTAVFNTMKSTQESNWQPGIKSLGLKEGALDFAIDQHNRHLISPQVVDQVLTARERIINGLIEVESYRPN